MATRRSGSFRSAHPARSHSENNEARRQAARLHAQSLAAPTRQGKGLVLVPVIALVIAVPLLIVSVMFSLTAVQFLQSLEQLGAADSGTKTAMVLLSGSGWFALAAVIVCAIVCFARRSAAWRWSWSVAIVLCAAANPIAWKILGFF